MLLSSFIVGPVLGSWANSFLLFGGGVEPVLAGTLQGENRTGEGGQRPPGQPAASAEMCSHRILFTRHDGSSALE